MSNRAGATNEENITQATTPENGANPLLPWRGSTQNSPHAPRRGKESMFTTAAKYAEPAGARDRSMRITRERRQAWIEKTAASPFNRWLDAKVKKSDGSLDLDRLYEVACDFGIITDYRHLNPGQQRMTIGNKLRNIVPSSEYAGG
jgi:hypothetical protein